MAQTTIPGIPTIGEVIRAWRTFRKLSSTKLAEKAGVRSQYVSEIEHDRTANPREEYLEKLAAALKVPLAAIHGRRMPPDKSEAGGTQDEPQGADSQPAQQSAAPSTVLHAPLSISDQEVMKYRLAVVERKFAAAAKNLQEAYEEFRELQAFVEEMFNQE